VDTATSHTVDITGTVNISASLISSALTQIAANLQALSLGGKNNLGEDLTGTPIAGKLYVAEVIEQIQVATGVRNLDLSTLQFNGAPATDTTLAVPEVLVLTVHLTAVGV
jgi:hypothetical protein